MQGVLEFENTHDSGSFQPYRRVNAKRTKSGCLSCRARHTKCDEHRPVCGGCARNHLLCSWTSSVNTSIVPVSAAEKASLILRAASSPLRLGAPSPDRSLYLWPQLYERPAEQRLLHYYIEKSPQRLIARDCIKKPFLAHVLPLAQQNNGLLHNMFAISATDISYDDQQLYLTASSHYAVALRAAKYLITAEYGSGVHFNPLETILSLLGLRNFKVIDGNTKGASIYHLLPFSALVAAQKNRLVQIDADYAYFIAEQYIFLGTVNQFLSLGSVTADISRPTASLISDASMLPYRSYYHMRSSGCGHALFKMIPRIALFAAKPARSSPRHLDPEIVQIFESLEEQILLWQVPSLSKATKDSVIRPNPDEIIAAVFQQIALLVTLRCALNGPGIPSPSIRSEIETCISEAIILLKSISPSSMAWATLLWPLFHIGSCITSQEKQKDYVFTILRMETKASCTKSQLVFLSRLWRALREDEKYYGPYGIRALMDREGIILNLE